MCQQLNNRIRREVLQTSFKSGACHIGSALSCVDILVDLFYTKKIKADQFLFSKASGVATLYVILADLGYFPKEKTAEYLKQYPLASKEVNGILHSVGSIAHGLSVACGLALANRNKDYYVLLSDGEIMEGSTYEACLFARQHKIKNLYVIVDNNSLVACGKTTDILDLETAFSFMLDTLPNCQIVNTTKGDGVDFMENDYTWHYKNLTQELLDKALKENE